MQVDEGRLQDFLFDTGVLSRGELARVAALAREEGRSLQDTLVHTGALRDDDVRRALAHILGIPFVVLTREMLEPKAFILLPEAFSRTHNVIALGEKDGSVEVALLNIEDFDAVQEQLGERKARVRLTNRDSLMRALIEYQKYLKNSYGSSLAAELARIQEFSSVGDPASHDAIVRAADLLLSHALHQRASGIHLEPSEKGLRVRYRIGGGLFDAMTLPLGAASALLLRFKLLAQVRLDTPAPTVGRFKISQQDGSEVRITVSSAPLITQTSLREKLVLTLSYAGSNTGLSLGGLGFSETNAREVRRAMSAKSGLVLVCGSEGAGKTTLLYTLLDECATSGKSLATVETHVSYTLPSVAHMEINRELGLTAASCLRTHLRQDADVIVLDCALDEEALTLALNAANRGALILVAVDAASAAQGVEVVQKLGVPRNVLSSVFVAAIGVATSPQLCAHSRQEYKLSRAEQSTLEEVVDIKRVLDELKTEGMLEQHAAWKDVQLYNAAPCDACEGGYSGTLGFQEVISTSMVLKDALQLGASISDVAHKTGAEQGLSLAEDATVKAAQGTIGVETLLEIAGR